MFPEKKSGPCGYLLGITASSVRVVALHLELRVGSLEAARYLSGMPLHVLGINIQLLCTSAWREKVRIYTNATESTKT